MQDSSKLRFHTFYRSNEILFIGTLLGIPNTESICIIYVVIIMIINKDKTAIIVFQTTEIKFLKLMTI